MGSRRESRPRQAVDSPRLWPLRRRSWTPAVRGHERHQCPKHDPARSRTLGARPAKGGHLRDLQLLTPPGTGLQRVRNRAHPGRAPCRCAHAGRAPPPAGVAVLPGDRAASGDPGAGVRPRHPRCHPGGRPRAIAAARAGPPGCDPVRTCDPAWGTDTVGRGRLCAVGRPAASQSVAPDRRHASAHGVPPSHADPSVHPGCPRGSVRSELSPCGAGSGPRTGATARQAQHSDRPLRAEPSASTALCSTGPCPAVTIEPAGPLGRSRRDAHRSRWRVAALHR